MSARLQILQTTRRMLGKRLGDQLIKAVIFDQFVVEPTESAILATVKDLGQRRVGVLLAVPIENDDE